jgi:hypothetical protein
LSGGDPRGLTPPGSWARLGAAGRAAPAWFAIVAAALGLVAATVLVGRPVGLGVSVVACAVFVAAGFAAPPRDAWSIVWWVLAAALAGVALLRAAGWVVWPSMIAAVALASLAASGGAAWRQVGLGLVPIGRLVPGLSIVARSGGGVRPRSGWRPALTGAGIGTVLLGVFVPLFATADAAFAHLLVEAVPDATVEHPIGRFTAALGVVAAGGGLLLAGLDGPAKPGVAARPRLTRIESTPPLAVLVALFAAFVALQLTTLYGGDEHVLETAGLTYAEYAREGFAQLIVAAALTLAVIAGAVRWGKPDRVLLGALCALTLVILASALTRLGLYEEAYGFTRLRLAAHAVILWLGGVFVLLLIAGALRRTAWLPRATVALTGAATLAFALADPDRLIAERNVDRYERTGNIDRPLLKTLSPDAAPAIARLPPHLAACATRRMRTDLDRVDALAGLNLARAKARDALRAVPLCDLPA